MGRLTLTADRSRFGKQTKRETECKMNKSLYLCVTVIVLVVLLSAEASGKTTSPFLSRLCQKCDYCNSDPGCDGCAKCSQCFGGDQTSKEGCNICEGKDGSGLESCKKIESSLR